VRSRGEPSTRQPEASVLTDRMHGLTGSRTAPFWCNSHTVRLRSVSSGRQRGRRRRSSRCGRDHCRGQRFLPFVVAQRGHKASLRPNFGREHVTVHSRVRRGRRDDDVWWVARPTHTDPECSVTRSGGPTTQGCAISSRHVLFAHAAWSSGTDGNENVTLLLP